MSELNWYTVKQDSSLYHYGVSVPKGKKILLDKDQADLHGLGDRVEQSDPPKNSSEAAILSEYQHWVENNSSKPPIKDAVAKNSK
jgi:hypothetical protein